MYPEWNGLSGWAGLRKPCPGICLWNGMRFPVEGLCGNYIPVFGREMGCSFRLRVLAESATRNLRPKRDVASRRGRKRKLHPTSQANSGTQFPAGCGLRTRWGSHETPIGGVKNKWYIQQLVLMWGGGTILLVAQNIGPPIEELSSGSITGIG